MANLSITRQDVGFNQSNSPGLIPVVQVAEAVTQGQPGYLDSATNKYRPAQATTADAAKVLGIFVTPASADGWAGFAANGVTLDLGTTLTVGETYAVSQDKGLIRPVGELSTGHFVTTLGTATAADKLPIRINVSGVAKP